MAQVRLNLKGATTLLLDSDNFSRGLIVQMLRGFGMDPPSLCDTGAQAKAHLEHHYVDLCIMEAALPDMDSAQLISWIRRVEKGPMRFIPIIVLSGYTQLHMVAAARDSGANSVIKKPVSPQALFDRINWVARVSRPFIETGGFAGPDRRFRSAEPRDGRYKRQTDGSAEAPADSNAIAANAADAPVKVAAQ